VWHHIAGVKLRHSLNHVLGLPTSCLPQIQMWHPRWPPETAAARSAPAIVPLLLKPVLDLKAWCTWLGCWKQAVMD